MINPAFSNHLKDISTTKLLFSLTDKINYVVSTRENLVI